ncbi:unnamed protein product [Ilex paraguariensis]|uniref:DIRP domain-containing protein n=1 Tax=Ilex paraguariensis TaxID=185542 RepID=A0ABC8SRT5_9AQUA
MSCELPSVDLMFKTRDAGKKSVSKGKRSSQSASPKLIKHPENSSSTDRRREGSDSALSSVQVSVANQVNLPTKVRSRRKIDLQKPKMLKDLKFSDKIMKDQPSVPFPLLHDKTLNLKANLSNCLSNDRVRRWCAFEWFYSAIDYPWFAKREFVEYLYHVGLGHVPRLTRVEWGVIRSSLGKPRRFSEQFLKEEKEKLNQYRNSVRTHYTELRAGIREGLPTDLARPLSVGQRVVAIHPRTREIHDGSVLTVDHTRCRVQFDRPELGVEFVMDIDCMPTSPLENMPTSLGRHAVAVEKLFENFNELKVNGWAKDQRAEGCMNFSPGDNLENVNGPSHLSPSSHPTNSLMKLAKTASVDANSQANIGLRDSAPNQQTAYSQPCTLAQIQAKEADVQALTELTRALDKKEAVFFELRRMNDDVLENQKDGDRSLKDAEPFKKQYAAVSSALYCLRQRNTYQGNFPLAWPRPMAHVSDQTGLLGSFDHSASHTQESGSLINEIVESSRTKARTMVEAAMQVADQIQAKEADVQALTELTRALDKKLSVTLNGNGEGANVISVFTGNCIVLLECFAKEAVFFELRRMNDDVLENQKDGDRSLKDAEPFKKQYAAALSSLTVGGKVEEAVDYVNDRLPLDDSLMPAPDSVHVSLASQDQLNSSPLNSLQASDPKLKNATNRKEQIPSELITHCVATLFMIQKCTERQFPPADVAQILESAVTSLQPCCSENLPVYSEIQKCMGIIRNQILALIPT